MSEKDEPAQVKLCPKCGFRPRYVDKRGHMHGYCKEDRNKYQRDYQRARYTPVSDPNDGRGFDRRVREAKDKLAGKVGVCCICLEEPASAAYASPLCEEDAELIQKRKLPLTPGMWHYLALGKNLREAPDIGLLNDPKYIPVQADDEGNVPGSPFTEDM